MVVISLLAASCGDTGSSAEQADDAASTTIRSEPVSTVATDPDEDDVDLGDDIAPETEDTDDSPEREYLELAYWEGALPEGYSLVLQPDEECDNSDPEVLVCEFTETANLMATHIGYVSEASSGTRTTYLTELCEWSVGTPNRIVRETAGTITTKWGDELYFEYRTDSCVVAPETFYWRVTGGTGRFEGASGLMSAVRPALQAGFIQISAGTLRVRASLWEEILPTING